MKEADEMFAVSPVVLSIAFVATIVFISIKLVTFVRRSLKVVKHFSSFPGRKSHWFWGTLKNYPGPDEAGLAWQRQTITEFPLMGILWLGPFIPMVMLDHPDTARQLLRTSEPKASRIYGLIKPWVGDGLLLSSGEKWNRNRRLLTPAFHFDILRPYMTINNQAADVFLDKLTRSAEEPVEAFDIVCPFTLDVVLRCAFSYETNCQTQGAGHPYVNAVLQLSDLASIRFFKPWVHDDFIYSLTRDGRKYKKHCNFVHKVSEDIIAKRKLALLKGIDRPKDKEGKKRCLDFLDVLLTARDENNVGLTDMEIRDEVDTFLFEGHDTTASAISWTLFSFAEHPEIQRKAQEEVDSILKGRDTDYILWDDLPKLEYLTMCLKESLRLHSPVPFISRQLTKDLKVDDFTILKGTTVGMCTYNIHHNPTVWENSLKFCPERFTSEAANGRDPYAFVPFSAGSRNCIGQNFAMHEMKVILARILRRFTLELTPNCKVEKLMSVVMRSKNGIYINAKPRW